MRHKFFAKRCEVDTIKFPSKLEASYYNKLKLMQKSGEIVFFNRQVIFDLPGGVKHIIDFLVWKADGTAEFIEVKGRDLQAGINKRKMVEALYPIKIIIVTSV